MRISMHTLVSMYTYIFFAYTLPPYIHKDILLIRCERTLAFLTRSVMKLWAKITGVLQHLLEACGERETASLSLQSQKKNSTAHVQSLHMRSTALVLVLPFSMTLAPILQEQSNQFLWFGIDSPAPRCQCWVLATQDTRGGPALPIYKHTLSSMYTDCTYALEKLRYFFVLTFLIIKTNSN